jgi:CII-binding regulator of phage lambda lysogenization HflD
MRYRRLASQFGDDRSGDGGGGGAQITKFGRARFAEMQYDNPNNKEMCQLLNATKLPYILMYKGSKGKVDEFQCSPAEFQHLIDAVNELADPAVAMEGDTSKENEMSDNFDELEVADTLNATATTAAAAAAIAQELSSTGDETIDGLKKQLEKELAEKFEMFEIMKAQIEYDKEYVLKLETGVETQRSMLEAKDGELSILQSLLKSNENAMLSLSTELSQQQEETQRAKQDLSMYQTQVSQLTSRISQIESTVASIELESSFNEKLAREKERQLLRRTEEWDELKNSYEKERSSLRQLAVLGVKHIGRGARYFLLRLMRKKID